MFCRLNINAKKYIPIRPSEMGLLILVVKNNEPVTSVFAAEFFKVSKPMIASMVNNLIKQGYITKAPDVDDKRRHILKPEQKAIQIVNTAYNEYFKVMSLLKDKMGTDKFLNLVELLEQANGIIDGN